MKKLLICSIFLIPTLGFAQSQGATAVVSWEFGTNTDFGQQVEYFPSNVLGFPADSTSESVPSADPVEIVSLGLGGWIILEFANKIHNGPGVDFVVFENVFWPGGDSTRAWQEPGIVSVSSNGTDFITFPYDSVTLTGCAGLRPTISDFSPDQFPSGGGDGFDLETVGLSSARFVKIEDRSRWVRGGSGFDLDAVVSLYPSIPSGVNEIADSSPFLTVATYPNPFNPVTTIQWHKKSTEPIEWKVVSLTGQHLLSGRFNEPISGEFSLNLAGFSSGTYLFVAGNSRERTVKPLILLK